MKANKKFILKSISFLAPVAMLLSSCDTSSGAGSTPATHNYYTYVANSTSNTVSLYNLNTLIAVLTSLSSESIIATGVRPGDIAVDSTAQYTYVANTYIEYNFDV